MMKKVVALLICLSVTLTGILSLAGCGKRREVYNPENFLTAEQAKAEYGNEYRIVKEPITLKVFVPKSSLNPDYEDLISFQKLSEVTNIQFDFIEASIEAYSSLRSVTWENKDNLPDLFLFNNELSEQLEYSKYGALVPWNDAELEAGGVKVGNLIENYMPTYKALLDNDFGAENAPVSAKSVVTLSDGKMYSVVSCNQIPRDRTFKMYLNQKWINDLNADYPELKLKNQPETIDEYLAVLRAFKKYDANHNGDSSDEIPLSALSLNMVRNFILCAYGYTENGIEIEDDMSEFVYVPATDNYREYLKTMNTMYAEGLLDNSTFEMTTGSQLAGKGYDNRLGSWADAAAYLTVGTELEDNYTSFGPLTSSYSSKKLAYGLRSYFSASGAVIPTGTPYVREIARLIDIFYTDFGNALMAVGVEGENWSWDDEAHTSWTFHIPDDWTGTQEEYRALISPSVGTGCTIYVDQVFDAKQNNSTQQKINAEVERYIPYVKNAIPDGFKMTSEQYNRVAAIIASLDVYRNTMESKFIKGDEVSPYSDADWNNHLQEMKKYRYEELVQLYNEALVANN